MIQKLLHRFVLPLALRGNTVECPVCEKKFLTFLPFGYPLRANARCPSCGSLERTRLCWLYLKNRSRFFNSPQRILHIAPEKPLFERFEQIRHFDYCAADKFEPGYRYPAKTINMDITSIQFPDNQFDFILCSHVLEHIPDDKRAMRELFRVLRPGGFGLLPVPIEKGRTVTYEDDSLTSPEDRAKAFGQADHVRSYGSDYPDRLRKAGFMVSEIAFGQQFSPQDQFRYGLFADEILYVVEK